MCGISLCFSVDETLEDMTTRLTAMERAQTHRGPDGRGIVVSQVDGGVFGIGQQRLSILDLSPAGSQPMVSPCGRYVLSYNGEVYNYRELAVELGDDPVLSISSGDTAVVLAALIRWGPDAFRRFNGMWALALFDRERGTVLLSRDRLGVKPLYFSSDAKTLVAASEVKTVLAGSAGRHFKVNKDAVGRFLFQSLTSAGPETFFRGVDAFPAGCYAEVRFGPEGVAISPTPFWRHPFESGREERTVTPDEIRELILDSVRLRMRSDVPVGILLSGGLDSSSLLSAARTVSPNSRIQALSVISRDPETSEEPFIDRMVAHADCEIIKIQSDDDPQGLWDDLDATVWHFDHPVSSFSNIAHRRVIKASREQGVIVLLTGQGADEQLGGYNKFLYFYLMDRLRRGDLAGPLSMIAGCIREGTILREFKMSHAKRYIPFMRSGLTRDWVGPLLRDANLVPTGLGRSYEEREWRDMTSLSLPDLLDSEDRASMSWGCEMRTPFLDYRLVEALAQTPTEAKLSGGWTKHILRRAMADMLPSEITWRKDKKGYSLPGGSWMTGPLRGQIHDLLQEPLAVASAGFVDAEGARQLFAALVEGRPGVRAEDVLSIIALELWMRRFARHIDGAA